VAALLKATGAMEESEASSARVPRREESACRDEIEELAQRFHSTAAAIEKLHQRLKQTATTDELTGLYNGHHLMDTLEREIARSRLSGEPLALVVTDLNNLRQVIDGLGHGAGDEALRAVASALRSALRASDVAARTGGDEFVAVLPECSTADLLSVRDCAEER
jgi:GGDEF domain-containing protein